MSSATELRTDNFVSLSLGDRVNDESDVEATTLAQLCRTSLHALSEIKDVVDPSRGYTAEQVLALPLTKHRAPDELYSLPRRRSARHELAERVAYLLYPVHSGSLTSLIRYEEDRVRLRGWAALQRKYDLLQATKRHGYTIDGDEIGPRVPAWASRITRQGVWDPAKRPVSLDGVPGIPMPVKVSQGTQLEPFFEHLRNSGTHELGPSTDGKELDDGKGEPHYKVRGAEFRRGVVYEDGRMDLCKMVVGPDHIWNLMDSLRTNSFVRHFLLGNNIIGPSGAKAIATFIREFPERMDTWYLAGNCIDGPGFKEIVDAMVSSPAVTNVWMKRNPLGAAAAADVYRLITLTPNLRTLDLDQTELGNKGVTDLFNLLAGYSGPKGSVLPLRNIYLNGCGISVQAAEAIASFLVNPHCGLTSLYLSCNPLGDTGIEALARALPNAPNLTRLSLQSVGVSTQGAIALCESLTGHPGIRCLDLGQAYATEDLQQAYNYIDDGAVPFICKLLKTSRQLELLNLAHCPITTPGLLEISSAILHSSSMLYYFAVSIVPDPTRKEVTFTPSRDLHFPDPSSPGRPEIEANRAVLERLEANVKAKYGQDMTYTEFRSDEKRWLNNDKEDVRKIDSVYRNRDASKARRGLMTLVKDWEEGDNTLARVKKAQAPVMVAGVGA